MLQQDHEVQLAAIAKKDPFRSHLVKLLYLYQAGPPALPLPTYDGPSDESTDTILRLLGNLTKRLHDAELKSVAFPLIVGDIARVCSAVTRGDLSQKVTTPVQGVVMSQLKDVTTIWSTSSSNSPRRSLVSFKKSNRIGCLTGDLIKEVMPVYVVAMGQGRLGKINKYTTNRYQISRPFAKKQVLYGAYTSVGMRERARREQGSASNYGSKLTPLVTQFDSHSLSRISMAVMALLRDPPSGDISQCQLETRPRHNLPYSFRQIDAQTFEVAPGKGHRIGLMPIVIITSRLEPS
ncbi:hypothetical protein IMY05_C4392000400 [Salix suchowensis]|nr:hypothetical protein IMY05_C4392000400 [Salix suchowensis]